jgi:hypothetical protein
VLPIEFGDEVRSRRWQVLQPIAQRRQLDGVNVEAVSRSSRKRPSRIACCSERLDAAKTRTSIGSSLLAPRRRILFFENTEQFGLHFRPHLSDLVEQEAAAVCRSKHPRGVDQRL